MHLENYFIDKLDNSSCSVSLLYVALVDLVSMQYYNIILIAIGFHLGLRQGAGRK